MENVIITLVLLALPLAFILGYYNGIGSERQSWLRRVNTKDNSFKNAHNVDGKFYYIIEESHFCQNFKRRGEDESQPS